MVTSTIDDAIMSRPLYYSVTEEVKKRTLIVNRKSKIEVKKEILEIIRYKYPVSPLLDCFESRIIWTIVHRHIFGRNMNCSHTVNSCEFYCKWRLKFYVSQRSNVTQLSNFMIRSF